MTIIWSNAVLCMNTSFLTITCTKSTMETQIKGVEHAQSQQ